MTRTSLLLLVFFILSGCGKLEYSPNQSFDRNSPVALNKTNINRLLQTPGDDTIRFILGGDTQRAYDNTSAFVASANRVPGVDFVVIDGDISDFGLLLEMEEVHERLSKLSVPYIAVIGNHDLVSHGETVFKRMYGDLDFSFTYKQVKFICHNTNSREYKFNGRVPDLDWLGNALHDPGYFVSIGHVPPVSGDFDQALRPHYTKLLRQHPRMLANLYAHTTKTEVLPAESENDSPMMTTGGINMRMYSVITLVNTQFSVKHVAF